MKRLWKPLVLLLVIGLIAVDLFFDKFDTNTNQVNEAADIPVGLTVGELAPDFSGTTLDGETIRLWDLRGKTVLVNDFATWCGPCLIETPHLVDAYNSNTEDVVIIGTEIYKPIGLPTSWFIDPDGVIRYVHAGPMTADMIQRALNEVAAGREPDLGTLSG
jgi:peroxiredoxin